MMTVLCSRVEDLGVFRNAECSGKNIISTWTGKMKTLLHATTYNTHMHAHQIWPIYGSWLCCMIQVLGCNDHKPDQMLIVTRDTWQLEKGIWDILHLAKPRRAKISVSAAA